MTKRFKDNPKSSNSDKKIKVIDTKSGEATFVTKEEILGSLDKYKPISGPKNFEAQFSKQKENKARGGRIGLKMGSKCKLAMKGKGRAYGKNS